MIHWLYSLVPQHGAPVIFLAALLSCFGLPIPTSALMIAAGAFVAAGDLAMAPVAVAALVGAILGDQAGYWTGRVGGQGLWDRLKAKPKMSAMMDRAETELHHRATIAVIASRWPFSALGPWINLVSGSTKVGWKRFSVAVFIGDLVWVGVYLGLGYVFAARAKDMGATMGTLVGALTAALVAAMLGRALWRRHRHGIS